MTAVENKKHFSRNLNIIRFPSDALFDIPVNFISGYPQSCSCAKDGVRRDNCDLFKCNCLCDVTAGKCDFNCCCDPDCSADQVSWYYWAAIRSILNQHLLDKSSPIIYLVNNFNHLHVRWIASMHWVCVTSKRFLPAMCSFVTAHSSSLLWTLGPPLGEVWQLHQR